MTFTGLLLAESLQDRRVLESLHVTRTERWNVPHPADFQPPVWTALTYEGRSDLADLVAAQISRALKPRWYTNFSTGRHVYVIFPRRIFRYRKGDRAARAEAQAYALSVGIPEWQLDWSE
ncbi:MAG: hypothetical protein JXN59_07280 [Anaerolineae bacterium]|nr:hypothetical protein [Anaerolineae bacterium]